jgi:hypothetical protein
MTIVDLVQIDVGQGQEELCLAKEMQQDQE